MDIYRLSERVMAMDDAAWARHAHPFSVYSRFAVLPLLALAIWSRVWLGVWALGPVVLVLVFTFLNPRLCPPVEGPPEGWAGKGTAGERLWLARRERAVPARHVVPCHLLSGVAVLGLVVCAVALWRLDAGLLLAGLALAMGGKAWFVDRMVWLYEDMRGAARDG